MLPEPTLTFTLPSLHDGLPLDCRVFHPQSLLPAAHLNSVLTPSSPASPKQQNRKSQRPGSVWGTHCADGYRAAAIVAHPYAPLGGSFDDNIVAVVSAVLLRLGFVVCTFNFRLGVVCCLPSNKLSFRRLPSNHISFTDR